MFENLKEKVSILFSPKNKSIMAQSLQNPAYVPDSDERNTQLLFWKLLLSAVSSDEKLDQAEKYLFEDYVFEQCLSEKEWKQILSFKNISTEQDEFLEAARNLLSSIQKPELFNAFKTMIANDKILRSLKPQISSTLESERIENIPLHYTEWERNIVGILRKKSQRNAIDVNSVEYLSNPVAFRLKKYPKIKQKKNLDIIGAKLGLALLIIYSDLETRYKEKEQFKRLIEKYCTRSEDRIDRITFELMSIPENHLEMAYFGRFLVEVLDKEHRIEFLKELFQIARSDNEYSPYEDRDLRVISKYLLLDHDDFISAKLASKKT